MKEKINNEVKVNNTYSRVTYSLKIDSDYNSY